MPPYSPLTRTPPPLPPPAARYALDDERAALVSDFKTAAATQNVGVLIKNFINMTLGARLWDFFSTLFRPEGSKHDHLKSVAYLAVAASTEGYQRLVDKGELPELRNSAKHVLKHLAPQARANMLATPLELRDDGQIVAKVTIDGPHGEVSLDLLLTRDCFYDYLFNDDSLLTQDEIAKSCWMEVNAKGENVFLRQLADRADVASRPLLDNQDTIELIMTGIMGPGRVDDEHPAPIEANERLARHGFKVSPFVKNASYFDILSWFEAKRRNSDDAIIEAARYEAQRLGLETRRALREWRFDNGY